MTAEKRYQPNPNLVFTRLDENEAALLHLETKRYYSLNETGARIWELLQDGMNLADMQTTLEQEYEMEPSQIAAMVAEFLEEQRQAGLVQAI